MISVCIFHLYVNKEYKGEKIRQITKDTPTSSDINTRINRLVREGILTDLGASVYSFIGRQYPDAATIACAIDPFCYMSHLSAMEFHGLTERIPIKLYLTSPTGSQWKKDADIKMTKDLGDHYATYRVEGLPLLTKKMSKKIRKTEVSLTSTKNTNSGSFKGINDRSMRVSTIGRTFHDMLKKPNLCGGLKHVIETYQEHAETYLRLILTEIDHKGNVIDKMRAGYILDEIMNLKHPTLDSWVSKRCRGSSMKLDSTADFHHVYSEKWWISINLF